MKTGYLAMLFGGVVLPVLLLVLVALDALKRQEYGLRDRMARHARLTLALAADDLNRLINHTLDDVRSEMLPALQQNLPLERLASQAGSIALQRPFVDRVWVFMNPWGFVVPDPSALPIGALTETVRATISTGGTSPYRISCGPYHLLLIPAPGQTGIYTGYSLYLPRLYDEMNRQLPAWNVTGHRLKLSPWHPPSEGDVLPPDVNISETWKTARDTTGDHDQTAEAFEKAELSIALPWPLEHITLSTVLEDDRELLKALTGSRRLRFWAVGILAFTVLAGTALTLFSVVRDAAAARANSLLLGGISHDLRTPLASALVMAESLGNGTISDPGRRKQAEQLLVRECRRLSVMVEQVLAVVRMDHPAGRGRRVRLDLAEITRQVMREMMPDSGVAAGHDLPAHLHVYGNRSMLELMLRNLLDNASKYAGGAEVELKLEKCGLSKRSKAVLLIKDEGPGIPREEQRTVWRPYCRGRKAEQQHLSGIGMGLVLCRKIVRWHGGRISLLSVPGAKGCTFRVELPAVAA